MLQEQMDMPAIEELADKENDTFAQGGPIAGLARNQVSKDRVRKERSNVRSASNSSKPPLLHPRTDEKNRQKYKLYREPGDEGMGAGLIAAKQRAAALPSSRLSY